MLGPLPFVEVVRPAKRAEHRNTLSMALYANGGRFTPEPYVARGAHVQRMSNYCDCRRYDPGRKTGPRTALVARNLGPESVDERDAIRHAGDAMPARLDGF